MRYTIWWAGGPDALPFYFHYRSDGVRSSYQKWLVQDGFIPLGRVILEKGGNPVPIQTGRYTEARTKGGWLGINYNIFMQREKKQLESTLNDCSLYARRNANFLPEPTELRCETLMAAA